MAKRMSPTARDLYIERRNEDRYGKKAQRAHARRVKTFERNAASASFRNVIGEV